MTNEKPIEANDDSRKSEVSVGDVYEFRYPFIRYAEKVYSLDVDNGFEGTYQIEDRWRPGVEDRFVYPDDSESFCDGYGRCRLTVVGVYKPEQFQTRVFFKRQWSPPNDTKFYGLNKCRITSLGWFNRLKKGYNNPDPYRPLIVEDRGADFARKALSKEGKA